MTKALLDKMLATVVVVLMVGCSEPADKMLTVKSHAGDVAAKTSKADLPARQVADTVSSRANPYFIVVDKGAMEVQLHHEDSGKVKAYRCALGRGLGQKREKGDCRTPEGIFFVGNVYDSAGWFYTSPEGVRSPNPGQYGPKFIRVSGAGYSSIGIHGTDSPRSLGRRVSHGCIRISNKDILDLVAYVQPGMKIIIKPGPKDIYADKHPVQYEAHHAQPSDSVVAATDTMAVVKDSIRTMEI